MIIYCVPSNNTRLVIVSLSDCNQICKLLSGHNLLNSKSFIVLCCRCFFVKLFGTVVETSSGRHIHLSLRENRRFPWQSKNTCVAVDYFVTAFLVMTVNFYIHPFSSPWICGFSVEWESETNETRKSKEHVWATKSDRI